MRPNNVGRPNNVKTNTHKSPNNYVCVNARTHTCTHNSKIREVRYSDGRKEDDWWQSTKKTNVTWPEGRLETSPRRLHPSFEPMGDSSSDFTRQAKLA